jgi:hypothetical protein
VWAGGSGRGEKSERKTVPDRAEKKRKKNETICEKILEGKTSLKNEKNPQFSVLSTEKKRRKVKTRRQRNKIFREIAQFYV